MADQTEQQASQSVKITGSDTSGVETNYVNADSNGGMIIAGEGTYNNPIGGVLTTQNITGFTVPMLSRADVSQTVSASGVSQAFDTNGFGMLNFEATVSAISGVGASIYFELQFSDAATNWSSTWNTFKFTTATNQRRQGQRAAGRYYRYAWFVSGTLPSVTFTIQTTLKHYNPSRSSNLIRYSDLDLQTNGNTSTIFDALDCQNVGIQGVRASDGGSNASIAIQVSQDGVIFSSITGSIAINAGSDFIQTFGNTAYRFWQVIVTARSSAGTRVVDLYWMANNGG